VQVTGEEMCRVGRSCPGISTEQAAHMRDVASPAHHFRRLVVPEDGTKRGRAVARSKLADAVRHACGV
jgi:hypothetical protein